MYYQLTNAVKRRVISELKEFFSGHPLYSKISITNRFPIDESVLYGIIVKNSSADQMVLDANNYLGTQVSHTALMNIKGSEVPGTSISWVKDDTDNMFIPFKEDVSSQADGVRIKLQVSKVPLIYIDGEGNSAFPDRTDTFAAKVVVNGREVPIAELDYKTGVITLLTPPEKDAKIFVSYIWRNLALPGYYGVEIVSGNSFVVDPLISRDDLPLLPSKAVGTHLFLQSTIPQYDFKILIDGSPLDASYYNYDPVRNTVSFLLQPVGTNLSIVAESSNKIYSSGADWKFIKQSPNEVVIKTTTGFESSADLANNFPIESSITLHLDNIILPHQGALDSFYPGQFYYTLSGYVINFSRRLDSGKRLIASYHYFDGQVRDQVPLVEIFSLEGSYPLPDNNVLLNTLRVRIRNKNLDPDSGDYFYDKDRNEVVFRRLPQNGDNPTVSYKYAAPSIGPFSLDNGYIVNAAIPGVVLGFSRALAVGDKQIVIVSNKKEPQADLYGGKFRVSLSMDIVALDPMQQEEITDLTSFFFLANKQKFDSDGLVMEEVSIQGESEQPYDGNTTDQIYIGSISVAFLADWEFSIPLPVRIRDTYFKEVEQHYIEILGPDTSISPTTLFPDFSKISERLI